MENRRIDDLFDYLSLLINLRNGEGGYICILEIDECIGAIRSELDIGVCEEDSESGKDV